MRRAESDSPIKDRHGRSLRGGLSRSNSSQRGGRFDKRAIPPRPREERRSTGAERQVSHLIRSLEMVEMRSRQQSDEIHAASLSAVRSHTEAQHYLEAHNKLVVQTQAAILHESNKQAALHAEVAEARDSLGQTLQAHQQSTETVKSLQRKLTETMGEGSSLREQYDKLLSLFHQATDVAKERDTMIDSLKLYNEQLVRQVKSCEVAQNQMNAQIISSQTDSREAYTTIERQISLFRREQEVWQRNYNSEVQMLTNMCSEAETMRLEMIESQRVRLKLEAELQQSLLTASPSANPDCKRRCTQEELAMSKLRFEFAEEITQERTVCASATRHYEEHVSSTANSAYEAQRVRMAELEAQCLKLHADRDHLSVVNAKMHAQATADREQISRLNSGLMSATGTISQYEKEIARLKQRRSTSPAGSQASMHSAASSRSRYTAQLERQTAEQMSMQQSIARLEAMIQAQMGAQANLGAASAFRGPSAVRGGMRPSSG